MLRRVTVNNPNRHWITLRHKRCQWACPGGCLIQLIKKWGQKQVFPHKASLTVHLKNALEAIWKYCWEATKLQSDDWGKSCDTVEEEKCQKYGFLMMVMVKSSCQTNLGDSWVCVDSNAAAFWILFRKSLPLQRCPLVKGQAHHLHSPSLKRSWEYSLCSICDLLSEVKWGRSSYLALLAVDYFPRYNRVVLMI